MEECWEGVTGTLQRRAKSKGVPFTASEVTQGVQLLCIVV